MKNSLQNFIANVSFRQSGLMTAGTVVNSLLGLAFYILVARSLSVSNFGYFSLLIGIGMLFADLGDLGFGTAIIKFVKELDFEDVTALVLLERLAVSLLFVIAALIASQFYPANFLLSALTAISLLGLSQFTQSLLAWQKFGSYVATNMVGNVTRLSLIVILISSDMFSSQTAILAFCAANFVALAVAIIFSIRKMGNFTLRFSKLRNTWKTVSPYSNWLGLSFGLSAVSSRIDVPLIFFLGGPVQAGIYSSASKLVSVFPQVIAAVEGVFAPKIAAKVDSAKHIRDYQVATMLMALGLLVLIPVCGPIVTLLFGQKYLDSVGVLRLLLFASAVFFLAGPPSATILYKFGRSNFHFFGSLVSLFASIILYVILVPAFGAVGAAVSAILSNVVLTATLHALRFKLDHE